MSGKNRPSTTIPFLPILMVFSTLVGAFLWTQKPLISSRPDLKVNLDRKIVDNEVQARLWQDPFYTVYQSEEFKKYKSQCIYKKDDSDNEGVSNNYSDKECREFENPATIIKDLDLKDYDTDKDSSTYDLTVLLVMMDGGIYSENYESRLRTRYSVVNGLGFAGYIPTNSDKIKFINYKYPISDRNGANLDDCKLKANGNSNQDSKECTDILLCYEIYERSNREYLFSANEDNEEKLSRRVVVLWAEDEKFMSDFVLKNNALIKIVKDAYSDKLKDINIKYRKDKKFQFDYRIIGPRSSTTLSRIMEETFPKVSQVTFLSSYKIEINPKIKNAVEEAEQKDKKAVSDSEQEVKIETSIQILSPWSTMSDQILLFEYLEYLPSIFDYGVDVSAKKEFKKINYHYERTNKTDSTLVKELIEELCRRRAIENSICGLKVPDTEKTTEPRSKIVLISEWDTLFGRSLPLAFRVALCFKQIEPKPTDKDVWAKVMKHLNSSNQDKKLYEVCNTEDVLLYSYLRGIDGKTGNKEQILRDKRVSAPRNINKGKGDETQIRMELPIGTSQLDYLRRLSQHLKDIDTELRVKCGFWAKVQGRCGITAIGVLGSDVYDKLLILQAMKKAFPTTWFFTTDLDARLFDTEELKSTKNLIVASGFGLEINSDIKGFTNAPVFRNSYQTALFFSTLRAVGFVDIHYEKDESPQALKFKKNDKNYELVDKTKPRLFEIGRNGPVNISVDNEGVKRFKSISEYGDSISRRTHYFGSVEIDETEKFYIHPERPNINSSYYSKALLLLLIPFAALILVFIPMNIFIKEEKERDFKKFRRYFFYIFFSLFVFAIIIWFIKGNLNNDSEPFFILEGISVWPTEILRIFIIMLVLFFMRYINKLTFQRDEHLEKKYFLPDNNVSITDNQDSESDESKKWSKYIQLSFTWQDQRYKEAKKYWDEYRDRGIFLKRLIRSSIWTIIFIISSILLLVIFGIPNRPLRGDSIYLINYILTFFSVLAEISVLIFVVDSSKLSQRLIEFISQRSVEIPRSKQVIEIAARKGIKENFLNGYVKLRFIEEHTRFVSKFIYFPVLILLIGVISINKYFDAWNFPPAFIIILSILILSAVLSSFNLTSAAKRAKSIVLEDLQDNIEKEQGMGNENALEQMKLLKDDVINIRGGAYSPLLSQPVIQSILVPVGGLGILSIIEFLFRQ